MPLDEDTVNELGKSTVRGVGELVYPPDLGSGASALWVRVPPPLPGLGSSLFSRTNSSARCITQR